MRVPHESVYKSDWFPRTLTPTTFFSARLKTAMTRNTFLSQLLALGPFTLIPSIPNLVLRYITLGLTSLSFMVYFVHCNMPDSQVGSVETTLKEIEELFHVATTECTRDPRFIAKAGLKLATITLYVSDLRTGTMEAQEECRGEMRDLQLSILRALESTRQQKYIEQINHIRMVIDSAFPIVTDQAIGMVENIVLRLRSPRARQRSSSDLPV
ncbi:hypothetical protein B0H10DRAFT_1224566 [Mycena sp. CBHHK59/15]|nr:hypothetical protein B0H10DRAFT_1277675 [Mycena sp. CBHHK59/15]KAJ6618700.1 hypothetical protein B0H10DRAFT_1224566 [Mycena sp. CBHHK59/15]